MEKAMECFPGAPTIPIFGNMLDFKSPTDFIPRYLEYKKMYGDVVKLYIGPDPSILMINDYKFIEYVLTSAKILDKALEYRYMFKWLGNGLITSNGNQTWKKHRKLIAPSFNTMIIEEFFETFKSNSLLLVNKLEKEIGKSSFDIYKYMSLCSLDVICESAMGISVNAQNSVHSDYVAASKVIKEMDEILGDDMQRSLKLQDIQSMKYLDAVIKESLRLYPPVPFIGRVVSEEFEFDGKLIPKGVSLLLNIHGIHHNPNLYPDPESFKPERFLDETNNTRPKYAFLPFSSGVRNCIGQKFAMLEMKYVLCTLLRHYEFLSPFPKHEVLLSAEMILVSRNGIVFDFKQTQREFYNSRLWHSQFVIISTFTILIYFVIRWYLRHRKLVKAMECFPGAPTIPFIGNALDFKSSTDFIPRSLEYKKLYGDVVKIFIGLDPILLINNFKFIECVLTSTKNLDKGIEYRYFQKWLGKGLLTAKGDQTLKKHRKLIVPSFNITLLEEFLQTFKYNSLLLVDNLKKEVGKSSFDVCNYISLCALDIICESTMGTSVNAQNAVHSDYVTAVKVISAVITERWFSLLRYDCFYIFSSLYKKEKEAVSVLHKTTDDVIKMKKKKNIFQNQKKSQTEELKKLAFLDSLLRHNQNNDMTEDEIKDEVNTIMVAGHDPISSVLSFVLYCLSNNPEVQRKVVEEMDAILGKDTRRPLRLQDIQSMKYLDAVIKESLRLYPPVPFIGRTVSEEFQFDGKTIPKGTSLLLNIYGIHHDPNVYPDPQSFKPERFMDADNASRPRYAFIPFSSGMRDCIGQKFAMVEVKSIVCVLLQHYEFSSPSPKHEVLLSTVLVLSSRNGIRVRIVERKR
ncbi:hypothetical protein FQA39_LY14962 [Lamprigera yunnana]|nr:hypothetical protein FQA39_LY14962 [Lamprigera yunnana]